MKIIKYEGLSDWDAEATTIYRIDINHRPFCLIFEFKYNVYGKEERNGQFIFKDFSELTIKLTHNVKTLDLVCSDLIRGRQRRTPEGKIEYQWTIIFTLWKGYIRFWATDFTMIFK